MFKISHKQTQKHVRLFFTLSPRVRELDYVSALVCNYDSLVIAFYGGIFTVWLLYPTIYIMGYTTFILYIYDQA